MIKQLFLAVLLLYGCGVLAQYPDLSTYSVSSITITLFGQQAEVPPWIIPGGWRSYFFVNGIGSSVMSTPVSIIGNGFIVNNAGPNTTSNPYTSEVGGCPDQLKDWKRNYYGIYSAHYLTHPIEGTVNLAFLHAENRNVGGCQNTINADNSTPGDWRGYNGFIDAAWIPNFADDNWGQQLYSNEMGPIAWPSTAYIQPNGLKASCGLRHPSSIVYNDTVFVFYLETGPYGGINPTDEEGRRGGIKMVMAPVSDCLNPSAYKAYYQDPSGNEQWNPSLPSGFNKATVWAYVYSQGPKTTDLMNASDPSAWSDVRFSVAQVRNTNYFIGVEEYTDNGAPNTDHVALRFSSDLRHWTERKLIIYDGPYNAGWAGLMHYPIFLSSDGWSNNVVDATDFWVLGTPTDANIYQRVNKIHVYYTPPPPPPTPPTLCYDDQGLPMDCPVCYDDLGNQIFCPQSQKAKALNGTAAVLDVSNGNAAYVYPNPGHGLFQLTYALNDHAITQLNVLDITGRKLQTGATSMRAPGRYTETVNISGQAKGVYLLELLVNGGKKTFKIILQ